MIAIMIISNQILNDSADNNYCLSCVCVCVFLPSSLSLSLGATATRAGPDQLVSGQFTSSHHRAGPARHALQVRHRHLDAGVARRWQPEQRRRIRQVRAITFFFFFFFSSFMFLHVCLLTSCIFSLGAADRWDVLINATHALGSMTLSIQIGWLIVA